MQAARYTRYRETGAAWCPTVPQHWDFVPIRRIGIVTNGGTPPSEGEYWDGEIPFMTPPDLRFSEGREVVTTQRTLTRTGVNAGSSTAPAGSVVVSIRAPIGYVGRTVVETSFNQGCRAITPDARSDPRYTAYSLVSARDEFDAQGRGTTFMEVSASQFMDVPLPRPPLVEQQAIADFLDEQTLRIDTLKDKQTKLIATLRERRSAVISHAVTRGVRANAEWVKSGIESLGSVPSHWRVCRMKHLGRATIGLTYTPADLVGPDDGGTLVLRSGNVQEGQIALLDNVYVSAAIPKELRIVRGDIVVCSRNGSARLIGKNALATDDVIGQTWGAFMTVVRSDYSRYLHWILNSQVFASQTGTFATATINQLTTSTFHNLAVALPPREERDEIVAYLDRQSSRIDALIAKTQEHIAVANERRTALLTAAVTGQIDVRTSNRLVEGVM